MRRIAFHTAGESHGRALTALLEGIPAGLSLEMERDVDPELKRRQGGYGRGRRMKIESDRAELLSGVRLGETLGSPISMVIWNRDWENWTVAMSHSAPEPGTNPKALRPHYLPRPGHADLVGVAQVRPARRAGHPGAGERAGDRGPRGVRGGRQAAARGVRRAGGEPRRVHRPRGGRGVRRSGRSERRGRREPGALPGRRGREADDGRDRRRQGPRATRWAGSSRSSSTGLPGGTGLARLVEHRSSTGGSRAR